MRRDLLEICTDYRVKSDPVGLEVHDLHQSDFLNNNCQKLTEHKGSNYVICDIETPVKSVRHLNCLLLIVINGRQKLVYHLFPDNEYLILDARKKISEFSEKAKVPAYYQCTPYAAHLGSPQKLNGFIAARSFKLRHIKEVFKLCDLDLDLIPVRNFGFIDDDVFGNGSSFTATVRKEVCFWNDQFSQFITSHDLLSSEES